MTGILVNSLHKSFGKRTILDNVNLNVEDGEFVCLLGPSGCGKSTLLRSIAGLENPEAGRISLGEDTVFDAERGLCKPPEQRGLGMVFQSFALWPHKTVFDNVSYPLERKGVKRPEILERVKDSLEMVDLWELRNSYPGMLSGGQQQRVSLARAVVARPRLLLLDEPLSSLDTNLRAQMRREIRRIQQHLKATAVYVTHDKEDAGGLADRVIILQDGSVVQKGVPHEVFIRPKTAFVAEFVGFDNFFSAKVVNKNNGKIHVEIGNNNQLIAVSDKDVEIGEKVTVAIRSRLIRVDPPVNGEKVENAFIGTVSSKAHLGDDVEVVVTDGTVDMVARIRPIYARNLEPGIKVAAQPPEGTVVIVQGVRKENKIQK